MCRKCHDKLEGGGSRGKVLGLYAKLKAGELDLEWYGTRPGYSVSGMLEVWRERFPELEEFINEILGAT